MISRRRRNEPMHGSQFSHPSFDVCRQRCPRNSNVPINRLTNSIDVFKEIGAVLIFIIFLALSVGAYQSIGATAPFWEVVIAITFLWLVFLGIMYVLFEGYEGYF